MRLGLFTITVAHSRQMKTKVLCPGHVLVRAIFHWDHSSTDQIVREQRSMNINRNSKRRKAKAFIIYLCDLPYRNCHATKAVS